MTDTVNSNQTYRAWLVRTWPVGSDDRTIWRASVEDAHTGERRAFADLPALFAFLEEVTLTVEATVQDKEHIQ